ncbi:aldo/keto reductase [Sphingobacterium mizutaii]|uniref:aldo/keto reductase n=1 Tax=Sphingobacterium mizutaii TaxID=1010 RepID=UPI001BE4DB8A|nr:aldo/keto reductase [Sphingobacterium mizutaii]
MRMQYNNLGKSELKISEIGLGAMSLVQGHDGTNSYIIKHAQELGINYLDTSDLYDKGKNEELIGRLLEGNRDKWILASKVGNKWKEDGSGWDWAPSKAYILKSVDESLSRLRTDYLDLYQLHGGTIEDPFDEIVEAFELLVQQGKIRYYGISSIRPKVFLNYAKNSHIVSDMMQYSIFDRRPEAYFQELADCGISVLARGTVAQGLLLKKAAQKYLSYSVHEVLDIQREISEIANKLGVNNLALALKYPLLHHPVACSVLGIRTREQINSLDLVVDEMNKIKLQDYQELLANMPEVSY